MRAFVLKKIPYGETDLILHFILENGLRQAGFAAGGRRSKRRFSHQFDPIGFYEVEWARESQGGGGLQRIRRCDLLAYEFGLANNIEGFSRWMTVLEWIDLDEESDFAFDKLLGIRQSLANQGRRREYLDFFREQLVSHGITPHLESCVVCHKDLAKEGPMLFSVIEGGGIHSTCNPHREEMRLSFSTYEYLQAIDSSSVLTEKNLDELDRILVPFLEQQLGKKLKSHSFLKAMISGLSRDEASSINRTFSSLHQ